MNPILWIHGFPLSPAVFDDQKRIEGIEHVIPPLPGMGGAPLLEDQMTIDDYGLRIVAELDARGIERATLAGISMGGYIAFAVLRRWPERIERLILIDTRETPDSPEARRGRFATMGKVRTEGIAPVVESMLPKMLTANAPREMKARVRAIMESASPAGIVTALRAMAGRPDSSSLLRSITVPTLVIGGEEDSITPPADAERMAAAIPGARLVILPGAAHLSNLEQPEAFNAAVAGFL